jgi:multidrug resistance efflux pump
MNIKSRLKLWAGIIVVLIVMSLLTILFNQRQHSVASVTATVDAPVTVVASGYGGVVIDQAVHLGDSVKAGQHLFTVSSASLLPDTTAPTTTTTTKTKPLVDISNIAYDVNAAKGTISYKAVTDGYISELSGVNGTFLAGGVPLATIVADGQRTVLATYRLAPLDYGRIENGAQVELFLPNNKKLAGTVTGVSVKTDLGEALAEVTVKCDDLKDPSLGTLGRRGTPVVAVMSLRDDGILAGPTQMVLNFLTKVGLR